MKKLNQKNLMLLRERVEPFNREINLENSLFQALASSICSQQLSLKAAATIFGRFKDLFPNSKPDAALCLKLKPQALRGAGLSEAKTKAIFDLAEKTLEGVVPTDDVAMTLSDGELIDRLTAVRGIGKWTVEMILMFRYRRIDVWPVDDLGVQKGFRLIFPELKFKNAKELAKLGDHWKGRRSEIAWYCWRALEEEQEQTFTSVPVTVLKKKMLIWLKGEDLWRVDFNRTTKKPKPEWPGILKDGKTKSAIWQKRLDHAVKHGVGAEQVNPQGTAFQQQVWAAIASIPWGETRTYLELAQEIGNAKGVRAVAQACGANPLPLFIPCHRVVGEKDIGGFRGGVPLKRLLLASEKKK